MRKAAFVSSCIGFESFSAKRWQATDSQCGWTPLEFQPTRSGSNDWHPKARSQLSQACSLYRNDLLADCGLEDLQNDWLYPERERLRELARSAFWTLFSLHVWRGQVGAAERCAGAFLKIDPYDERLHAALMRLRISQGRRAAAARQFAKLSQGLAHDLAVEPSSELVQLASSFHQAGRTRRQPFDARTILGRFGEEVADAPPLVSVSLFQTHSDRAKLSAFPEAAVPSALR